MNNEQDHVKKLDAANAEVEKSFADLDASMANLKASLIELGPELAKSERRATKFHILLICLGAIMIAVSYFVLKGF
jgi:hypothetical protein